MDKRDFYELLGVKRGATTVEIRRAYRRLARRYHPDINPGDPAAELHYQALSEAFEILSNPAERDRYDRGGRKSVSEPPEVRVAAGYDFEGFDFTGPGAGEAEIYFAEIFGRSVRSSAEATGENLTHHLTMGFEESLSGLETAFEVTRLLACARCRGRGRIPDADPETCRSCKGRGRLTQARGHMVFARPCPECGGAGVRARQACSACGGAGRTKAAEALRVRIPPGVRNGSRVRVAGKGNEDASGRPGDLYVIIQVTPHAFLSRDDHDLTLTLPITFSEAALGCRIELPLPDGPLSVKVLPATQCGHQIRVKDRGAFRPSGGRGELVVTIQVVTPRLASDRGHALMRELAELHPERPRAFLEPLDAG
jgi:molecular chaperone DnaJ